MSKIKMPKKKACVDEILSTENFVPASFRFVPIPGPKNSKATIMIGCPCPPGASKKKCAGENANWNPTGRKKITDRQGVEKVITGVCKVGTRAHAKIQAPVNGKCRKGYTLKSFTGTRRRKGK